jgi:arsenite methyltransferase
MGKRTHLVATAAAMVLGGWPLLTLVAYQHHPPESASQYIKALEDPERETWQQPEAVIHSLGIKPGDDVADLGAGSGYFTVRLAEAVGPAGRVYAVDIDPQMLDYVERRAKEEQLENVQTILAEPNDPKLGSASVDLIFICDTLHHISNRDKYYPRLARALKSGGRLVNIDFEKRATPLGPPLEMRIAKRDVIKEIEAAGFRLIREFDFLKYQYFLVFEH